MADRQQARIKLWRGIRGASICGLAGAIAPATLMIGLTLCGWAVLRSSEFERGLDWRWLKDSIPRPTIGCASVCAGAGWATFAPAGTFRFARTLAIVAAISILWPWAMALILWLLDMSLDLVPERRKGIQHPSMYRSEFLVLFVPPILAGALVAAIRIIGGGRPDVVDKCKFDSGLPADAGNRGWDGESAERLHWGQSEPEPRPESSAIGS